MIQCHKRSNKGRIGNVIGFCNQKKIHDHIIVMVKSIGCGATLLGFEAWLCLLLALWTWQNLPPQCFHFLICKMRFRYCLPHRAVMRSKWINTSRMLPRCLVHNRCLMNVANFLLPLQLLVKAVSFRVGEWNESWIAASWGISGSEEEVIGSVNSFQKAWPLKEK